ncbi:Uncharacterized protein SCF082_LOCUS43721 [Durusdinium trenchii]|uniref:Uncharacterized protein n=1 Tax=Durusdinium trenchii TaxID=1381693 RepID=A0ABP0QX94_9DINO
MPFTEESTPVPKSLRCMRDRQRSWVMAGLQHIKAPVVVGTLMALLFSIQGLNWDDPGMHLECFAGKAEVTRAGRPAVALDASYGGPEFDLLTDVGFTNALFFAANLQPGASCVAAPVCSTFVFMSSGSTWRTRSNPYGRTSSQAVRNGTILACRCFILLLIASAKKCWWVMAVMEQPSTSCMEALPCFQHLCKIVSVRKLMMSMADYGGPTEKRTALYSSSDAIDSLPDYKTPRNLKNKEMVPHYIDGQGISRVCGGSDLRGSQAYPRQFGIALSKCRTLHERRHAREARKFLKEARASTRKLDQRPRLNKAWVHGANLDPVMTYLSNCK